MPRVPYNPTKYTARPATGNRVDFAQDRANIGAAIEQVGENAKQIGAIARIGQQVAGIASDYNDLKREKETRAAMGAFDAKLTEAVTRAQIELNNIKVADGVDFEAESSMILEKHYGELSEWIDAPNNIPDKGTRGLFEERLRQAEAGAKNKLLEFGENYRTRLSIDRGKRMVETGIATGNQEMIEKGYFVRHEAGEFSLDAAELASEKAVVKMKEGMDKRIMDEAELLLMDGDIQGFSEKVDSLNLASAAEKAKIKTEQQAKFAGQSALKTLEGLTTIGEIEEFMLDPELYSSVDSLTDEHRRSLKKQAEQQINKIQRKQDKNFSEMVRGLDRDVFLSDEEINELIELDDSNGINRLDAQHYKYLRDKSVNQKFSAAAYKDDTDSLPYKGLSTQIQDVLFNKNNVLDGENIVDDNYSGLIDKVVSNRGIKTVQAKGDLIEMVLRARSIDIQDGELQVSWGFNQELSPVEIHTLNRLYDRLSVAVQKFPMIEGAGELLLKAEKNIHERFGKDGEFTEEEIEKMVIEQMQPLFDNMALQQMRKR